MRLFVAVAILLQTSYVLAQTKEPVPAGKAVQEALTLVKEVYESEYAEAKTPEQKEKLAQELLREARGTKDTTQRYALLRVARDLSIQAGGTTAFAAVDEMARSYQIDGLDMNAKVLAKYGSTAKGSKQNKAVAEQAVLLIGQAIEEDRLTVAGTLAETALATARKAGDDALAKQVAAIKRDLEELASASAGLKTALDAIEANPADPEANLAAGRYYCLLKGDWDKGLSMLALGSDPALKELAVKELRQVAEPREKLALGDGWWDLAEKADGIAESHLRARAVHWYKRVLPKLSGLHKVRLEKRLREVGGGAAGGLAGSKIAAAKKPKVPPKPVLPEHTVRFTSADVMKRFVVQDGAEIMVQNGVLGMKRGRVTYGPYFKSISSVKIVGGIVPPKMHNFRASVGPVNMILNWEMGNENHIRYCPKGARSSKGVTRPPALIPGKFHVIEVKQIGNAVVVLIDGRRHFAHPGTLEGTVTIYPAHGSQIAVKEIAVEGKVDPTRKMTGPSHGNLY